MRLIDADALKDRLQALSYDDWNQGVPTTWASAFAVCADMVEAMPTFEPEQKKGQWIEPSREGCLTFDYKAFRECSMCGKKQFLAEKMNFCPNCGADMTGEQP